MKINDKKFFGELYPKLNHKKKVEYSLNRIRLRQEEINNGGILIICYIGLGFALVFGLFLMADINTQTNFWSPILMVIFYLSIIIFLIAFRRNKKGDEKREEEIDKEFFELKVKNE